MSVQHILNSVQKSLGFSYSFLIYYGVPFHHRALTQIYAPFIRPGDLCFDLGAHLGDRVRAWSHLGARIIALEPHPDCMRWLRHKYGKNPNIVLIEQAVGTHSGTATLWISRLTPSLSTLSREWLEEVQKSPRFSSSRWEEHIPVRVTTLDALIAQYGMPAFCKIDVEGAELDVLQGLSQPIPALSFEYIPATIETALGCIDRLSQLGDYEYNWRVSEFPRLRSHDWLRPRDMIAHLQRMKRDSNSGDVYARLISKGAGSALPT
ncbi:MAG TPA: FkbM family methyltransferase [Anaerolineales bacterium]|nr:FkbM family methyltransferase [Anaerolineales bacterium]